MKKLITLSLLALSVNAVAATAEWKVIAESKNCDQKVQILAKEGEKFLKAKVGDSEQELISTDKSAFQEKSMKSMEYVTDTSKKEFKLGEPTVRYIRPSEVEGNPAKIDIAYSGVQHRCLTK